jgi:formylglycine-generating enzyme required for sulfatase activity
MPLGAETRLRDLLALDREEHPRVTGRWVVKGDPGAGKTTLLRHLAGELAGEDDPPWVPVLESLPKLVTKGQGLLERVEEKFKKATREGKALTRVLDQKGQEGRLLVLLDGLDEVPRGDREDVEIMIRELSSTWPKSPVVVTTRPIGYQPFDHRFVELEVKPLDRERRLEFLARWFGRQEGTMETDRATAALEQLEGSPTLWDLSGNPLYLTLIALLLEEGKTPDPNRTRLYDQVFALLLDGKHRGREARGIEHKPAVHGALRFLGYTMTVDNTDLESEGEILDRLYRKEHEGIRKRLERFHRWRDDLRLFLGDLAEKTGILGEHDGPGAGWKFWHRSFREALAAEELEAMYRQGGEKTLLEHAAGIAGKEGQWAEPYALLTGRLEEPDTLVRALVGANRTLGLRALATAQTLSDATIGEVLELSDDPDERAKVYRKLPELVGEGERALLLLDRLRKGTRNGHDLFFLDLAVRAVGTRWGKFTADADRLLTQFFNHIPAPDPDLFRWVETKDGRVPLWREIPAGSFLMGSPEDEEGGNDRERPTHTVKITQPFGMASVPVTNRQYRAFDPDHRWYEWEGVSEDELAQHPVVTVSWYAAVSFCRWLASQVPGLSAARLATEAEWEYACRGGKQTAYWNGDKESDLAKVGWYEENSEGRTHRVGRQKANPFGLYDVHGNVWEWTVSPWTEDYSGREAGLDHDPRQEEGISPADLAASSGELRVFRGGCFWGAAVGARSACRDGVVPWRRSWSLGFRVVLPVAPEPSPQPLSQR